MSKALVGSVDTTDVTALSTMEVSMMTQNNGDSAFIPKAYKRYVVKWVALGAGGSTLLGGGVTQAIQWVIDHFTYIP
jgi:hypothetical protein